MRTDTTYDPEYATCAYTHIWLRVMHETLDPNEVTKLMQVEPTNILLAGTLKSVKSGNVQKYSGWFLESTGIVDSLDSRHHIDWLLSKIEGKSFCFAEFKRRGYLVDICCRWDSASGHGGPILTPDQMLKLGSLGIEFWFDIYFNE